MRNFLIVVSILFSQFCFAQNLICLGTFGENEGEIRVTIWENPTSGLSVYAEEINEQGEWAEASAQLMAEEQPPYIIYIQNSKSAGFLGDLVLQFNPATMTAVAELAYSPMGNENLFIQNMACTVE